MDEPIFCPKCEGTQHEHNPYNPRIHHSVVRTADFLVNRWKWRRFGPIVLEYHDSDEEYMAESYRCQSCNHSFLSSGTYAGQIQYHTELRKNCLFWGLLSLTACIFLAFTILLDCFAGFTGGNFLWICALGEIPLLILTCILFGGIFFSFKESNCLQKEWDEFQNVQAKHTSTINSNSEAYIPAWKRVQMAKETQDSL